MGKDSGQIKREIEATREEMGDTVEAIGYRANVPRRMKDSISDTVGAVKDKWADTTSGLRSGIAKLNDQMPDASDLRAGARQAVQTVQENPLGLALGAVAVGFLAGLLLPSTDFEREKIGPMTDRLKDNAVETGKEILDRSKQVAQDAAQAAQSSAQRHGQELASSVKERAKDIASGTTNGDMGETGRSV